MTWPSHLYQASLIIWSWSCILAWLIYLTLISLSGVHWTPVDFNCAPKLYGTIFCIRFRDFSWNFVFFHLAKTKIDNILRFSSYKPFVAGRPWGPMDPGEIDFFIFFISLFLFGLLILWYSPWSQEHGDIFKIKIVKKFTEI